MEAEYQPRDFADAMGDPRVQRALTFAMRDRRIYREFRHLRGEVGAQDAIDELASRYCLSVEHIRTIVYHKRGNVEE